LLNEKAKSNVPYLTQLIKKAIDYLLA